VSAEIRMITIFTDRAPRFFRAQRQSRRHGADPQATGKFWRVDYQLRDGESEQEADA